MKGVGPFLPLANQTLRFSRISCTKRPMLLSRGRLYLSTQRDGLPSTSAYSQPSSSRLIRIARGRYFTSRYFSQRSGGSRICPSASMIIGSLLLASAIGGSLLLYPALSCPGSMFCHIGGSGGPQLNIHRSRSPVEQAFRFEEVSGRKRVRNGQAG